MAATNAHKHLTCEDCFIIETGIRNGSTKSAIADTFGKDKSTIGKEIKEHRILSSKCPLPLECSNYKKCKHSVLTDRCCILNYHARRFKCPICGRTFTKSPSNKDKNHEIIC